VLLRFDRSAPLEGGTLVRLNEGEEVFIARAVFFRFPDPSVGEMVEGNVISLPKLGERML